MRTNLLGLACAMATVINTKAVQSAEVLGNLADAVSQIHTQRKSRKNYPAVGYRNRRTYKPNGALECARRLRQIAAGSLKAENGLVL